MNGISMSSMGEFLLVYPWDFQMGVSKIGVPQKWMVYFMENPIQMDDLEVFPYFWFNTQINKPGKP